MTVRAPSTCAHCLPHCRARSEHCPDALPLNRTSRPAVPEMESAVTEAFDAINPNGELPMRGLAECAVFEEEPERGVLLMRDLQVLDGDEPTPLDIVGRVTALAEDGSPRQGGPAGPVVRLSAVTEWSVEYADEMVIVWVSTETADYKLLSPAPQYTNLWEVLQRKTALAARVLALLADDPTMTYKALLRQTILCNSIPGAIQFKADEPLLFGRFLVDQIANSEELASCRALIGLREALERKAKEEAITQRSLDDEEKAESDPNKRQRKATKMYEAVPSHTPRAGSGGGADGKGKAGGGAGGKGKAGGKDEDPNAPRPAQSAFMYYSKEMRTQIATEGLLTVEGAPLSYADVGRLVGERWKGASKEVKATYEEIAAADKERFIIETAALEAEKEAREAAAMKGKRGPKRASLDGGSGLPGGGATPLSPGAADGGGGDAGAGAVLSVGGGGGGGATSGGGDEAGKKRKRAEGEGGEGAAAMSAMERLEAMFPMEDVQLHRKEAAHRAMLVASGR